MQDAYRDSNRKRPSVPGWLRSPFGARSTLVITFVALLALVAGSLVVLQITDQMRREADDRLATASTSVAHVVQQTMTDASSDIRLARQNVVFEKALADIARGSCCRRTGWRSKSAITYLGERYQVDEICVIRASGLEAARWVGGQGVAAGRGPLARRAPGTTRPCCRRCELADDSFFQIRSVRLARLRPLGHRRRDADRAAERRDTPASSTSRSRSRGSRPSSRAWRFGGIELQHPARSRRAPPGPPASSQASAPRPNTATDADTAPFPLATAAGSASWRDAVGQMLSGGAGLDDLRATAADVPRQLPAGPGLRPHRRRRHPRPRSCTRTSIARSLNLGVTAGPLLLLMLVVDRLVRAADGLGEQRPRRPERSAREHERPARGDQQGQRGARPRVGDRQPVHRADGADRGRRLAVRRRRSPRSTSSSIRTTPSLHVSNQSQDRAVPQATLGDREAEVLSLHDLGRCPAVRRSSLYVTDDVVLAAQLPLPGLPRGDAARSPASRWSRCGETVGAVHLHWAQPRELPLPVRLAITRVSEHSALSIANRRLAPRAARPGEHRRADRPDEQPRLRRGRPAALAAR